MKIAIIGGGASGLIASIFCSTKENNVTILEKNSMVGKKILLTGNGKCNYWNEDQNLSHYHTHQPELLKMLIPKDLKNEILPFFESIGIIPKIKNGYYYPTSNQAKSIKESLLLEAKKKNVQIKTDFKVSEIKNENGKFFINPSTENLEFDIVILSTGGCSYPKIGSDGLGYLLAKQLGHRVINPTPSLVQLITQDSYKDWSGVRTDAIITLYENGEKKRKEQGEIQLTDYGVSGICVFNISYDIKEQLLKGTKQELKINFLPFLNIKSLKDGFSWLEERSKKLKTQTIEEQLNSILNDKLIKIILKKSHIKNNQYWNKISQENQKKLVENLFAFSLLIKDTKGFEQAQVTNGGIPLEEINLETLESKKVKNLYFTGEILDVNADCGGYNLGFAWMSGIKAGKSVKNANKN